MKALSALCTAEASKPGIMLMPKAPNMAAAPNSQRTSAPKYLKKARLCLLFSNSVPTPQIAANTQIRSAIVTPITAASAETMPKDAAVWKIKTLTGPTAAYNISPNLNPFQNIISVDLTPAT